MISTCDFWQGQKYGWLPLILENVVSVVRQPGIQNIGEGGQKWGSKLLPGINEALLPRKSN